MCANHAVPISWVGKSITSVITTVVTDELIIGFSILYSQIVHWYCGNWFMMRQTSASLKKD